MARGSPSSAAKRRRDPIAFLFGEGGLIREERYAVAFGGRLAVLDMPRGSEIRRHLVAESGAGAVTQQSAMDLLRPERLVFAYEQAMAIAAAPRARSALLLGLGGGAMVRFLAAYLPDCALTIVEHDEAVVELARRHFHIDHPVEIGDARAVLAAGGRQFDAILVDTYGADGFNGPPLAFWEDGAAALASGGTIAINWADARDKALYRPHAERIAALTARSVYLAPQGFKGNVVQLCSADPGLDTARLRERAAWLARRQRRKSILDRCAILDGFP